MNITVFKTATGEVVKVASVPVGMANIQVSDGEDWLEGNYQDDVFYIDGHSPVQKPPKPSDSHKFNYSTKQWELDVAHVAAQARQRRATLLQQSDWAALPDVPMSEELRTAWAIYRQDLRDVTSQPGYPTVIYWPVAPG